MLVYFAVLAALGVTNILGHPESSARSARYIGRFFFVVNPMLAFLALGVGDSCGDWRRGALRGHGPFRAQADRLLLADARLSLPDAQLHGPRRAAARASRSGDNPFFLMAPDWARLPLVVIATLATIIASQAVISGAFSVTHQAIQLGFLPRLRIKHTSAKARGQIYIPAVNWGLAVDGHRARPGLPRLGGKLASAYGIAVTGTMLITTIMLCVVVFRVWKLEPAAGDGDDRPLRARRRRLSSPRTSPRSPTAAGSRSWSQRSSSPS